MTLSRDQVIVLTSAALLLLLVVFVAGRGCSNSGMTVVLLEGGIDAGPGEAVIANRLDGSVQLSVERMELIEEKFEEDLAAFDERQRADYDRVRGGDDLEAAARMLSEWNHRRRDAGR